MTIQITDVFLRDGLQDEPALLTPAQRIEIGQHIAEAGATRMEVASFVNPRRVPQMAGAEEVLQGLQKTTNAELTVLTLNGRGVERAMNADAEHVQIVTSASEEHSRRNAGQTIEDAMKDLGEQVAAFPDARFFAGISTAFTCPFEGRIDTDRLVKMVRTFYDMGITDIGLADTIGTTTTEEAVVTLKAVLEAVPEATYSLHLHNAKGQALATVDAAIELGICRFDAAVGGYGGCPFAPGAAGNLATEELVAHLHRAGLHTGFDENELALVASRARELVQSAPAPELQEFR